MKKHTYFIIFIIAIALMIGIWRDNQDNAASETVNQFAKNPPPRLSVGTALSTPQLLPEFVLTDMEGNPFTDSAFKSRWSFLFFGYTSCPELCPTTLDALHQISQRLHAGPHVQFVFITIDPVQDTAQRLKTYFQQDKFKGAPVTGITGDKKIISQLASTLGVHVAQENPVVAEHIEHGGAILLINPEGKLAAVFTSNEKPPAIVHDFKEIVHHYNTLS